MERWTCIVELDRRDRRWSPCLDGDELVIAQVTSKEAAQAVKRLFAPQLVNVVPPGFQRHFFV